MTASIANDICACERTTSAFIAFKCTNRRLKYALYSLYPFLPSNQTRSDLFYNLLVSYFDAIVFTILILLIQMRDSSATSETVQTSIFSQWKSVGGGLWRYRFLRCAALHRPVLHKV